MKNRVLNELPNFIQKYSLQLLSKNNKIWKVSDISIIDLRKKNQFNNNCGIHIDYFTRYKRDNVNYYKDKDYLFIGII